MRFWNIGFGSSACAALFLALLAGSANAQPMVGGHPDFSGLWQCRTNCGNGVVLPHDKLDITPEGQKLYAEKKAGVDRGDPAIDTGLMCHPLGIPRLAMFGTFDILQRDDHVAILGEWLGPGREIYFANQHRKDYFPTFMGDSIARWDGNTLVIDTIGVKKSVAGYLGMPHSDQMRITERIGLVGPDFLHDQITIEDPVVLEKQVTYTLAYARIPNYEMVEFVCDNNREYVDEHGVIRMKLRDR